MSVTVNLNTSKLTGKLKAAAEYATFVTAEQALKDCNYFCREQTGELIRSSLRASDTKAGRLVWNTPYAKRMYYLGQAETNVNPNATKLWGEKAKAEHGKEWAEIAQKAMRKGVDEYG